MTLGLAGAVLLAIAAPHALALERSSPSLGAFIWMAALALRALTAVFCALFVVLYLPATQIFSAVTHWCWEAVVPLAAAHLHLNGHAVGDLALVLPAFVLAASALFVAAGLMRTGRRVRLLLARAAIGPGPGQSVVLADGDVLVAAAGLRRPQVVVSAGALLSFDDQELAASLEHEHGHIARRHRFVLVAAEMCRALARFLPGTRAAAREVAFHLERDADRYAIARAHDPAALATAICKAARCTTLGAPALGLNGGSVNRRVRLLLEDDPNAQRRRERPLRALACAMAALVIFSAAALPAAAEAGYHPPETESIHNCSG